MTAENQNEEPSQEGADRRNLSIHGNVDDSILVLGDRNRIHQGPSYYTTNIFGSFDANQFPAQPSQSLSQQEYRWRQVLVQNVKHYWIEGVLERSLHNQVLIELGLEERAQAVASPISGTEEFANETDNPFPAGTQATDIFDNLGAGRTLLILGEPGSGKTTILLKLTQTLINRIGDELSQPIPVVLNLSSWATKREPIAEWLVQDLYETFQVSKALGTTWVKEEQLTLCLDGLDEVAAEHRNSCVQALNYFLQTHGRTEVVVCSRIRDYEALSERLRIRSAIYVQPLTTQQIDRYLEQAGEQLSELRTVFSHNSEIRAFVASPLILSVMSLAYQGCSPDEFPDLTNTKEFRQKLFDSYIERMLNRRGSMHFFSDRQTRYWLILMAKQMIKASQTVFFIENIQPSWLQTLAQRLWYRFESSLMIGLIIGLSFGLLSGLSAGLSAGLNAGMEDGLSFGLKVGRGYLLSAGLISGLIAATLEQITPVETLTWSWEKAKKAFRFELSIGLIAGLIFGLIVGISDSLTAGLTAGTVTGLITGLTAGLSFGLRGPDMNKKTKPNQGIWRSARNAGIVTLIAGINTGIIVGTIIGLIDGLEAGLTGGSGIGLMAGVAVGLMAGGSACTRHFSLRLTLYRMGYIPWNYTRFLDYATERLFLQKVGGGYIFIHRMLLEHFAQMELEQKQPK